MTALPPPEEIERLADRLSEAHPGPPREGCSVCDAVPVLRTLAALQRADVGGESAEEFARRLRETTWAYRAIREFVMSDEDAVAAVALRGAAASLRCAALEARREPETIAELQAAIGHLQSKLAHKVLGNQTIGVTIPQAQP